MKTRIFITLTSITISLLLASVVFAQPDFKAAEAGNPQTGEGFRTVTVPERAVEVAPALFDLGTALDKDGKRVQGYAFVHYRDGNTRSSGRGQGGRVPRTTCYAYLAKGARWKTTEPYVLDPANYDDLTEDFVATRTELSLNAWDDEVSLNVFGGRDTTKTVDGADTVSPDGKNEVYFGEITDPGVIAMTIVWGYFYGKPSSRELVEWDAVFDVDDPDFNWGDAGPTSETSLGDTSVMDYQNIATHEFGHAAGMGHPSDSCTEETMYRYSEMGETKKRTLYTGDKKGIVGLYK